MGGRGPRRATSDEVDGRADSMEAEKAASRARLTISLVAIDSRTGQREVVGAPEWDVELAVNSADAVQVGRRRRTYRVA